MSNMIRSQSISEADSSSAGGTVLHAAPRSTELAGEVAVLAEGVRKSYGNVEVLRDINFSVHSGEVACLVGPSGSGNSEDGRHGIQYWRINSPIGVPLPTRHNSSLS